MSKDDHVKIYGFIDQALGGGQYSVIVDGGKSIRARLSGRLKKNKIRVLLGDKVEVAVSPYDMTHGMIVYRR